MSLNLGILLALACAIATQLGFLYKHKGANEAPTVDIKHPFRSAKQLWSCKWFAIGMGIAAGAWLLHVAASPIAPLSRRPGRPLDRRRDPRGAWPIGSSASRSACGSGSASR